MEFTDSADILVLALKERPFTGRVLLIQPDSDLVHQNLCEKGCEVVEWSWIWSGRDVSLWPPVGVFAVVVLRLPTVRELTTLVLEVAASRLAPGGRLYIYGANHEGMKSVQDHLSPWFEQPEVVLYKHRERVLTAVRSKVTESLRPALADWARQHEVKIGARKESFISYPGMFSHGVLDEGTKLLLEHLPECPSGGRLLDMGCGTGILARAMQERTPNILIDAVDLNALAIEATKQNASSVQTYWGDSWKALPVGAKYDVIVSNPPVHLGAKQTTQPLEYFITHAKQHLLPGGSITLVVQGTIPVKRLFDQVAFTSQLVAENKTYQVWSAR